VTVRRKDKAMMAHVMASALVTALLTTYPPVGCVIDCSTWDGLKTTRGIIEIETLDGRVIRSRPEYPAGTDPSSPRVGFKAFFENRGWEYEMIGEYRFFVRGSKAAPIRRVSMKTDGWTPTYYFVWAEPPREAPPPRAVNR
jgi:hypothetical protein